MWRADDQLGNRDVHHPEYAAAGPHTITATYSGDSDYLTSTSSTLSQTVTQASVISAVAVSSATDPVGIGQAVTYTATVNPVAATGTVEFKDTGTTVTGCGAQALDLGVATCTVASYAGAGTHTITAVYSGDINDTGSTSTALTQTVSRNATTAALSSTMNPSKVGQSATYTATISPAAATGTVEFKDGGTPIAGCSAQIVNVSRAECSVATYAAAGSHTITAVYSGDINDSGSTSTTLAQTVNKAASTIAVSSSANPSTMEQPVTYTATVSPAAATGTVEFKDTGATITGCTAQTVSTGRATCTIVDYAAKGTHTISATYSGDNNYLAASSTTLTQNVNKLATTTTLVSSLNPSTVGQAVTYTATVSPATATGTIEFKDAGTTITGCGTQTVSTGRATCTVSNPTTGSHWITASYCGDTNDAISIFPGLTQNVNKLATTTTLVSSLNPSTVGQAVTYTATVSPATATGTIEFKDAGTTITGCGTQTVSTGRATCTVSNPTTGSHWITASYSGDTNDAISIFPGLTQNVNKLATTTTLVSSLNPSTVGQAVTYTATVSPATATGTIEFKDAAHNNHRMRHTNSQHRPRDMHRVEIPPQAHTGSQQATPETPTTRSRYSPA